MVRRDPVALVGLLVVVVLVGAGPLTGVDVTSVQASTVGDGTATVTSVSVDTSALAVTDGRFGTNVSYFRIPPATVTVESVTGRPQLVYLVSAPGLNVDRTETRVVTRDGTYRLEPDDRALSSAAAPGEYNVTVSLRIQSFETDRDLTRANATVEVAA